MCVRGKLALFSKPATSDRVHILTLNLPFVFLAFVFFFSFFSRGILFALQLAGCAKSFLEIYAFRYDFMSLHVLLQPLRILV